MSSVALLLSKEFVRRIIIANLVAWPLAYYLMNRWLQNFAYRTQLGWKVFVLSLFILLAVSMCAVLYQTFKAAWANPVDSLRYE